MGAAPVSGVPIMRPERTASLTASHAINTWYVASISPIFPLMSDAWPGSGMTFYDDSEAAVDASTWPLCGRVVAALLSLPGSGAAPRPGGLEEKTEPCTTGASG